MNLPAFALMRRMTGRLRPSAFFFLRGLHGGSESTVAYRIDKALGRLAVIR